MNEARPKMNARPQPLKWELSQDIPRRMPVMEAWLETAAPTQPLKGITVLMLQHQLGNHYPQTKALLELGVSPLDLHWIDIPYTATASVREAIQELGVPAGNFAPGTYRVLDDYVPYQRKRVEHFIKEMSKDPPEHLLVLDDGSYFIDALARSEIRLPRVSIVEQTARGIIKIENDKQLESVAREFPILNVARSVPKNTLEPPFIGYAVCDALVRGLGNRLQPGPQDNCLILGYGSIGEHVTSFAQDVLGFHSGAIRVFDTSEAKRQRARDAGFTLWDREGDPARFKLVIGCSGQASFTLNDRDLLVDGAFLASATSGTVEPSRQDFIEFADRLPDDDVWIDRTRLDLDNIHSDLEFHHGGRIATFINAGFPVNFDGRVNCVPAHYIQPTPTMMCAAAVQVVSAQQKYLIELDPRFSEWLRHAFLKELGEELALIA